MNTNFQDKEFKPWLCVAVLLSIYAQQMLTLVGISNQNMVIKLACGLLYVSTLAISFQPGIQFIRERLSVAVLFAIVCLALYPLFRTAIDVAGEMDRQSFTDGFFTRGSFYITGISSLACLQWGILKDIRTVILRFVILAIPIAVVNAIFIVKFFEFRMNFGHCLANNFIIIIGLLILCYRNKSNIPIGALGVIGLLILSTFINSRSILLIGCYLVFGYTVISMFQRKIVNIFLLLVVIPLVLLSANFIVDSGLLQTQEMKADKEMLKDKLATDSLMKAFQDAWDNADLSYIYYWEGNSRNGILQDAFYDFTPEEWMFGRGIFGYYFSLLGTEALYRSTIELGFLQELFRWGIPYVIILLIVNCMAIYMVVKYHRKSPVFAFLMGAIVIRILDIMIYGLSENNNMTFFWWLALFYVLAKVPVPDTQVRRAAIGHPV